MAEKKYYTNSWSYGPPVETFPQITNEGVVIPLTIPIQGTTDITRIGDKVTGSSLEIRLQILPTFITPLSAQISHRITVFIWKDDTTPTMTDILYYDSSWPPTVLGSPVLWPFNHDQAVKRKILYDESIMSWADLETERYSGVSNPQPYRKIIIDLTKLKNKLNVVNYITGSTSGVNNIFLLLSNNISSTTPDAAWYVRGTSKYNYIDM